MNREHRMKRIVRGRRLTAEEAAKHKAVRGQIAAELPELVSRHHERTATRHTPLSSRERDRG